MTTRIHRSSWIHPAIAAAVGFFVLSPAILTPWGFGPDYTNHIWLIWQQGAAISSNGHPTLYLQTPGAVFEPLWGFYGGTLYAAAGGLSALFGEHPYEVYIGSIAAAILFAYGGIWWIGRQLGLSPWAAHLPAFVFVTGAYYITDAYARGAWTEFVALSAVPNVHRGGRSLLTSRWRPATVALFLVATVFLTGTHNITLFWSGVILAPIAVVLWIAARADRPRPKAIALVAMVGAIGVGVNAWFLLFDLKHSSETQAWAAEFNWHYTSCFNQFGAVLDPLRSTPGCSTTPGLTIAAPIAALVISTVLIGVSWPVLRRGMRGIRTLWASLLVATGWSLGRYDHAGELVDDPRHPVHHIQFPFRLAGWMLLLIAIQFAVALRVSRS